ncbi:ferritin-like domain-containing protein [Cristinia sonorae]|uniref:Ferritin-like domain-containing protein n=1 Tax=Cristinia sonorae TaxID=1940300 RepID=A0A8K0UVK0_9AGAR|nr:ferritin-like domain-containing protein [Cristinia sonorae]
MRFATSASLIALAASSLVSAAPVRRAADPQDLLVLTFAHVLEQFETQFYTQALAKFQEPDFTTAGFSNAQVPIQQFTAIQGDEATHTEILASTITSQGGTPVTTCTFNFDAALSDVATMAATARLVENLGVAAYLGAAHLVKDPVLLTAAGSILTVEARHQTVLNILTGGSAIPQAFDIPFSPSEVLAVASPFISGCDLGIPANPTLSVTNTGSVGPGTSLSFASPAINGSTDGFFCQMLVGGAPFAIALPFDQCVVPDGINGPVALFVTSDSQPLANNVRDQATDKIVAGPTMAFIDTAPEVIADLARGGSPAPVPASADEPTTTLSTSSTTTLTPDEASAVLSSAGVAAPTATAAASNVNAASGTGAITVMGFSSVPANA